MVIGLAFGALTGIFESVVRTAASPALDLAQQEVSKALPTKKAAVADIVSMVRRGKLSEAEFYERMARYAFNKEEADRVLFGAKFFPGAADLVTFVVKEGFTPEVISDLTQGEPTPEKFIDEMEKLGADKQTADLYWITHYDPLGRTEFEEMYHRLNDDQLKYKESDIKKLGLDKASIKFNLDDLKRMYRIKDIYPGLRDRMALLSFRPISRVDVRRLEDFDLIDEAELEFMNREIGYSPESSKQLAVWTRVSNTLKDLMPLLKSGGILPKDAEKILIEEGMTPEGAKKLINRRAKVTQKLRALKYLEKARDEVLKRFINDEKATVKQTKKDLMDLDLTEEEADAEIAIAIVVQHNDPADDAEQRALIDTVRAAAGMASKDLMERNKEVNGWIYTLDLEREENKQVDRFLAENHKIGDRILDVETGIYGEILARIPKFVVEPKK